METKNNILPNASNSEQYSAEEVSAKFQAAADSSDNRAVKLLQKMMEAKLILDYGFVPEDKYSVYDGWFLGARGGKYLFETKDRKYKHNAFPDGWMLEAKKKAALDAKCKELGYKGSAYINTFTDGKAVIWNLNWLDKAEAKIVNMEAPSTSAVLGGLTNKKSIMLQVKDAARVYDI